MPGTNISPVEVSHISTHGFWVLLDEEELFLPFEHFPWFRTATIEQICGVERPTSNHLFWPQLDIDLAVQSIRSPADYPLIAK